MAGSSRPLLFTPLGLIVAAALSCAAALAFSARPSRARAFAFEVRLVTTQRGHVQLYFDTGAGLSEEASSRQTLLPGETAITYRLPIPAGTYAGFRFDPIDSDGQVVIASPPRIVTNAGELVREIGWGELQPANQIESIHRCGDCAEVTMTPGADDPQFNVTFAAPLEMRAPPRISLSALLSRRTLAIFGVLALALFVAECFRRGWRDTWAETWRTAKRPPLWFTLVLATVILGARRPDLVWNPQFWAEDSIEFYYRAYTAPGAALVQPYAGYLHTVPRLVAATAMLFDPRWAPAVFVVCGGLGTLYVVARTQSARCPLPRHLGCALAVVLVPDAYEVLLNVVNLQWVLAGGLVLLLISADAQRWWQHAHDVAAGVLLGLTGPFSIFVAPLFAWRAWHRRTSASVLMAAVVGAAAVCQAWTLWRNPVPSPGGMIASDAILAVPGMRVASSLLLGCFVPQDFPRPVGIALGVATLVAVGALAARRGTMRVERVAMAIVFALLLAASLHRVRFHLPELCNPIYGSRYFFPLQLIVLWLMLAAASDERRGWSRALTALTLLSFAINAPRLREQAFPDLHWEEFAAKIRGGSAVEIPVNPEPWILKLPPRVGPAGG